MSENVGHDGDEDDEDDDMTMMKMMKMTMVMKTVMTMMMLRMRMQESRVEEGSSQASSGPRGKLGFSSHSLARPTTNLLSEI